MVIVVLLICWNIFDIDIIGLYKILIYEIKMINLLRVIFW